MIMLGVVLIIGIQLLVAAANSVTDVTEAKTVTNESMSLVNGTAVAAAHTQWDSVTRVGNTTVTLNETTQYTVDLPHGTVTLIGTSGTYDVSYVYRQVGNSTSRTLVLLIILFMAIGILAYTFRDLIPFLRDVM